MAINPNPEVISPIESFANWLKAEPGRPGRVVASGMLGLGFLMLLRGNLLWLLIFLVAALAIYFFFGSPGVLSNQTVVDRWDTLVDGGNGRATQVIDCTLEHIERRKPPRIALNQSDLAPGVWRGLTGNTRPFLIVSQLGNRRLAPYRMYVNVRDYGETLQASWFLTYQPGFFERLALVLRRRAPSLDLDLFDEQDLRAYVTAVHHCFLDAVVELLTSLQQDASKLERSSKGFLGIS